ncbi:LCP family protein [Clostridium sp. UBA6640]|uniref:LCP family protein n=1 Tax=Clostridium sp. UBA6640 TaxID=1946370 RepID=UPI0025BDEED8|nr:LCP family protein [Clostridium sp. UBA6640]
MGENKKRDNESVRKNKRKRKKSSILLRVLFIILLIGVLLSGGVYTYLSSFDNNAIELKKSGANKGNKNGTLSSDGSVNFLVMGLDLGSGDENDKYDPKRTDSIMLVHYNGKEKKYDVISIPRDTKVTIDGQEQKINAAHAIGGVQYLVDSVEELLNITIDYYVKADTIAFREFIDAIGGVDVVIERNMYYDDPTQDLHIYFEASTEPQHLDGKDAEKFVRWRKNNDETGLVEGDVGRIKEQQKFFKTLLAKIQSPSIIPKLPNVLSVFPKYIETNLSALNIMDYGLGLANTSKEKINFHIIGGEPVYINGISYFISTPESNGEILSILNNEKQVGSNDGKQIEGFKKDNIRINILNSTAKDGLAGNFGENIAKKGYSQYTTGNANENRQTSKIKIYGLKEDAVEVIKKDFNIDDVEYMSDYNENFEIEVILGEDRDFVY